MNEKFTVTVFAQEPNPNGDDDDDGDKDRYRSPARLYCSCCIRKVGRYFWSKRRIVLRTAIIIRRNETSS